MIRVLVLVVLVSHLPGVFNVSAVEGDARMRARHGLVVRSAARQLLDLVQAVDEAERADADRWRDRLAAQMLEMPAQHVSPSQSRDAGRAFLEDLRRQDLEARLNAILVEAERQSPLPVTQSLLFERAALRGPEVLEDAARDFAAHVIEQVFPPARQQAVARQLDVVRRNQGRPKQADLDTRLRQLQEQAGARRLVVEDLDMLRDWVAALVDDEEMHLFEETRSAARDLSAGMLARIREEYRVQVEALARLAVVAALPGDAIFVEQIGDFLSKGVGEAVASAWEKSDVPPYDLFAVVGDVIQLESQRLADERLQQFLADWVKQHITQAQMVARIEANPRQHKTARVSRQHFVDDFAVANWDQLVADYLAGAGVAEGADRLRARLGEASIQTFMRETIGQRVDGLLGAVRMHVAAEQSVMIRETVADIHPVAGDLVQQIWEQLPEQSIKNVTHALQVLRLLRGNGVDEKLRDTWIEETEGQVVGVVQAGLALAFDAQREQLGQVAAIERARREQLARDVADGVALDTMRMQWRQDFENRWAAGDARLMTLYPAILPLTEAALEQALRQYYDSVQAAVDAARQVPADLASTEDAAQGEADPQEPVEPTEEEEERPEDADDASASGMPDEASLSEFLSGVDVLLYFLPEQENVQDVRVQTSLGTWQASIQPGAGEVALAEVFALLQPALEGVLQLGEDQQQARGRLLGVFPRQPRPTRLTIAVLVGSREVRHMTSLLLRQEVERYLVDWSAARSHPPIDMEWQDGLVPAVGAARPRRR